jgi:hypothetical protein
MGRGFVANERVFIPPFANDAKGGHPIVFG